MKRILAAIVAVVAVPAQAEVVASSGNGFHIRHEVPLAAADADAWATFGRIGEWWAGSHTYSGDSKNLSLSLVPGGCFCERIPAGGGIEHLRVAYVDPGKRAVLTGALGPLLYEAASGVMDVKIESSGAVSRLTLDYKAAGFATGGADKFAPIVDQVLGEQVKRLRTAAAASARKR